MEFKLFNKLVGATLLFCLLLMLALPGNLAAQNNVGIGTASPNANALLDLTSPTQGILIPRMPAANRLAIVNPADALMVYDTDSSCFFFFSAGSNAWISLCSGGSGGGGSSANPYNTAVNFNTTTDSLSVTDGGGTLSAYIPLGRWSVRGTTDTVYTASATPLNYEWSQIPDMSITFTPTQSTIYIMATASGDADAAHQAAAEVLVRVRNATTNTEIIGCQSVAAATFTPTSGTSTAVYAWNASMTTAYTVQPNAPITIVMDWTIGWADGVPDYVRCNANSDPAAHRSMVIWE